MRRLLAPIIAASLGLVACGGSDDSSSVTTASTVAAPTTTAPATGGGDVGATTAPTSASTLAGDTTDPATTAPAPTVPAAQWSDTAAAALDEILTSTTSPATAPDAAVRLFGLPVSVPLPADAVLADAFVDVKRNEDDTITASWRITFATAGAPADLEQAVVTGFSDPRFEDGARVESTLDSGVFVTLNRPVTTTGEADGWELLGITVGPETDGSVATGRNEVEVGLSRTVTDIATLGLPAFIAGWLAELPVADAVVLTDLRASLVNLSTSGVWLDATFTAAPDRFAELVRFYAQDWSKGALVLEATSVPENLDAADYFTAGFFPTLAGFAITATVSRDLTPPAEPVEVELGVRLEAQD